MSIVFKYFFKTLPKSFDKRKNTAYTTAIRFGKGVKDKFSLAPLSFLCIFTIGEKVYGNPYERFVRKQSV